MGENEFKDMFNADEIAELQAAADEVAAQVAADTPKKNGIWYSHDENEGANSVYALNMGGKTILWFTVNNTVELLPSQIGGILPDGITAHRIVAWNSYRTANLVTDGFAARHLHDDGTGIHVDGNTVRAFITPQVQRLLAHFYGV